MSTPAPFGVYVHWPWCRIRCPYCAFNVTVDPVAPWTAYADSLLRQRDALAGAWSGPPETLFFGGGTPSLAPAQELARLVAALGPTGEVSLEANPEDVTPERLDAWRAAGVTRLSLGLQTFSESTARPLGRKSKVRRHLEVVRAVAAAGFETWSADLIFAVPGQTLADFAQDVDRLGEAGAPHVSLYGLTPHPETPYAGAVQQGRFVETDEGLWDAMLGLAEQRFEAAGLARYEVSNLARPGHRCVHNELIWQGGSYLGLGAGAHGLLPDGRRTIGEPNVERYTETAGFELGPAPSGTTRALDLLIGALRHVDGVDLDELHARGGELPEASLRPLLEAGLLRRGEARLALAGRGWRIADAVLSRLSTALCARAPEGGHEE